MFEYVKYMSQFSIIARKSNRKKVNMKEDILKDLLQDYFKGSFNIVSYVKKKTNALRILTATYSLILMLINVLLNFTQKKQMKH